MCVSRSSDGTILADSRSLDVFWGSVLDHASTRVKAVRRSANGRWSPRRYRNRDVGAGPEPHYQMPLTEALKLFFPMGFSHVDIMHKRHWPSRASSGHAWRDTIKKHRRTRQRRMRGRVERCRTPCCACSTVAPGEAANAGAAVAHRGSPKAASRPLSERHQPNGRRHGGGLWRRPRDRARGLTRRSTWRHAWGRKQRQWCGSGTCWAARNAGLALKRGSIACGSVTRAGCDGGFERSARTSRGAVRVSEVAQTTIELSAAK